MLDAVIAPALTFSAINCKSLNVSDLGSIHHLVKLYSIAKLKTDVIFISDVRLCNAQGVSNSLKISVQTLMALTAAILTPKAIKEE